NQLRHAFSPRRRAYIGVLRDGPSYKSSGSVAPLGVLRKGNFGAAQQINGRSQLLAPCGRAGANLPAGPAEGAHRGGPPTPQLVEPRTHERAHTFAASR